MKSSTSRVEDITAILRDEILRGQYRPGERLPSERDLAVRFEANRGAVREALKKLEQMGIAHITPGGVRVVPVEQASLDVLGHLIDLSEVPDLKLTTQVLEVLGALMSFSARSAIELAEPAQLTAMHDIVKDMIAHSNDSARSQQNWKDLGTLFTDVSNNLVLRLILNGLKTQFVGRISQTGPKIQLDRTRNAAILSRMDKGLTTRNARAVADAIIDHFELLQESVSAALTSAGTDTRSVTHG